MIEWREQQESVFIKHGIFCLTSIRFAFTVNGRMSSGSFDYHIDDSVKVGTRINISIQNSQVEIDAGYESPGALFYFF